MEQTLDWGILGTGNISRQFAAGLAGGTRSRVVAVASRSAEAARAFARQYAVPRSFGSYADLLAEERVQAVYVALPNSMHHEWTLAALRAGKHVLCEKPIAANADEAAEMFRVARECGRVLVEAFMYRSHPQTIEALRLVRSGAIGEPKLVRTSFCYRTRRIEGNIRFSHALAGGALMDVGCYCTDFSRLFAGSEPLRADVVGHVHASGIDDLAAGTLAFAGGVVASFACGMNVQADNTAWVCGTEGYLQIPVPWKPGRRSKLILGRSTPPRMDQPASAAPAPPPTETREFEAPGELYRLEADDFAAAVFDGLAPRVTPDGSIGNMRLLDALRRQLGIR